MEFPLGANLPHPRLIKDSQTSIWWGLILRGWIKNKNFNFSLSLLGFQFALKQVEWSTLYIAQHKLVLVANFALLLLIFPILFIRTLLVQTITDIWYSRSSRKLQIQNEKDKSKIFKTNWDRKLLREGLKKKRSNSGFWLKLGGRGVWGWSKGPTLLSSIFLLS